MIESRDDLLEVYEPSPGLAIYIEDDGVVIATLDDEPIVIIKFPFTENEYLNAVRKNRIEEPEGGDA